MTYKEKLKTEVIKVPDNWTDFDNERDELQ